MMTDQQIEGFAGCRPKLPPLLVVVAVGCWLLLLVGFTIDSNRHRYHNTVEHIVKHPHKRARAHETAAIAT